MSADTLEGVRGFVQHKQSCVLFDPLPEDAPDPDCDCGYYDALATLDRMEVVGLAAWQGDEVVEVAYSDLEDFREFWATHHIPTKLGPLFAFTEEQSE